MFQMTGHFPNSGKTSGGTPIDLGPQEAFSLLCSACQHNLQSPVGFLNLSILAAFHLKKKKKRRVQGRPACQHGNTPSLRGRVHHGNKRKADPSPLSMAKIQNSQTGQRHIFLFTFQISHYFGNCPHRYSFSAWKQEEHLS